MTTTPTEPTTPSGGSGTGDDHGPRVTRDEARDLSRLRRTRKESLEGSHIAGVAGGVARHLDIDPIVIRVALVVLAFFGGAGLLLYAVGWLVIPEEGTEHAIVRLDPRSRTFVLCVALGLAVLAIMGATVGHFDVPWSLGLITVVVLVVLAAKDRAWPSLHRHRDDWAPPPQEPVTVPSPEPSPEPSPGPVDLTKGATPAAPTTVTTGPTIPIGPAPRAPRRRGPLLFWPTLALVVLALGVLGIVDGAGAHVAASAYAALALGIIGAALLLGAFWGRAGGLILAGLLALTALVSSTAAEVWHVEGDHITVAPTAAAQLAPRYHFDVGEARVDLRHVQDLPALDGRTLDLSGNVGRIEVIVPADLTVRAYGDVNGPGHVQLFNEDRGGIDTRFGTTRAGAVSDPPTLTVEATLGVGEIRIVDDATRFGRN